MFRRGWVLKDDKLLMFEEDSLLVLRGWPECRAWIKGESGGFRATRPPGTVVRAIWSTARPSYLARWKDEPDARRRFGLAQRSAAAARFIAPFPREVLRLVKPLPERQWHLLSLLARCPGALDLARDNPALAFALASSWVFRRVSPGNAMRAARALVKKKRTAILDALGFPATPAAARVLAKLPRRAITLQALLYLRDALRDAKPPKALFHLPRLDAAVLRILCDPALCRFAHHALLEDVARRAPRPHRAAYLLADTVAMHQALFAKPLPAQRSLVRLQLIHDDLVERFNAAGHAATRAIPAPPLPGTGGIEPLATALEILAEGRTMHHCAGSYVERTAAGAVYVYRIDAPGRATLSLVRTAHGWAFGELRAFANAPAPPATRRAVARWLASHGVLATGPCTDDGIPF